MIISLFGTPMKKAVLDRGIKARGKLLFPGVINTFFITAPLKIHVIDFPARIILVCRKPTF